MLIEPTFPSKIVAESLADFYLQLEELKLQGIEVRWSGTEFAYSEKLDRLKDQYRTWTPIDVIIGNEYYETDIKTVRYLGWY
jgi:hypothetical protein